jgi:hypothetical protein
MKHKLFIAVWSQASSLWRCCFCNATFRTVNATRNHLDVTHRIPSATIVQESKRGGTFLRRETEPSGFDNLNTL